jgi:hypothetical protein
MAAGMTRARFSKSSCALGPGSAVLMLGSASLSDIILPPDFLKVSLQLSPGFTGKISLYASIISKRTAFLRSPRKEVLFLFF